jgi:hypothetical protein
MATPAEDEASVGLSRGTGSFNMRVAAVPCIESLLSSVKEGNCGRMRSSTT